MENFIDKNTEDKKVTVNKKLLFSDASTRGNVSIIGYKIGDNKIVVKKEQLKNTQAEMEAAIQLLKEVKKSETKCQHILYTDCDKIFRLSKEIMEPRDKHELKLMKLLSSTKTEVEHVKGHSKQIDKNSVELQFQQVDKLVRKTLRNHFKYYIIE